MVIQICCHHRVWCYAETPENLKFLMLKWNTKIWTKLVEVREIFLRDFFWLGYFLCSLVKKNFFTVGSLHKLGLVLLWLSIQNFEHVFVLVSIDFPSNSKGDAFFHCTAFDYFPVNWDGLHNYLKDVL